MFVLSEMKDVVSIKPHYFSEDLHDALSFKLNKKLANRVSVFSRIKKWLLITSTAILIAELYV